jgi:hypothetical protein
MFHQNIPSSDESNASLIVAYVTKGGKEVFIKAQGQYWIVAFGDGGQIPKELKGRFTRYDIAKDLVVQYFDNQPEPQKRGTRKKTVNKESK